MSRNNPASLVFQLSAQKHNGTCPLHLLTLIQTRIDMQLLYSGCLSCTTPNYGLIN